jgi:hypothetical protein
VGRNLKVFGLLAVPQQTPPTNCFFSFLFCISLFYFCFRVFFCYYFLCRIMTLSKAFDSFELLFFKVVLLFSALINVSICSV